MTIKTSISLPESQAEYARELVERGLFPSLSAVVQHSLEALRQRDEDERADRDALQALLAERARGPFKATADFRRRTDAMLSEAARKYALGN